MSMERIQQIDLELEQPYDPGSQSDINRREVLMQEKAVLEAQLQLEQVKQERITTALTETAAAVDSMDIDGISLRDLIPDEQAYQFVKIAFQTMLNDKDAKYIDELATIQADHKEEARAAAEREANLTFQLREKDKQLQTAVTDNAELQKQVNTLTFERDEAFKVRDNAAAELDGLKLALDEKQHQIDTLRAEIAVGAKGAVQIDQTEQLRQAKEAFLNSRIKVTNIRWVDEIKQREYAAELAETGETITFNRLEKGKYLEVSADEAARFRAERESAATVEQAAATVETVEPVQEASTPLVTGEVTPPEFEFRPEEETVLPVHQPSDSGGVVPQAFVTVEAFEEFKAEVTRKIAEITGEVA